MKLPYQHRVPRDLTKFGLGKDMLTRCKKLSIGFHIIDVGPFIVSSDYCVRQRFDQSDPAASRSSAMRFSSLVIALGTSFTAARCVATFPVTLPNVLPHKASILPRVLKQSSADIKPPFPKPCHLEPSKPSRKV